MSNDFVPKQSLFLVEERMRGRNPKGYQQLITKAFKEGDTKYCRAVMRKCIKIIRNNAEVEKDLNNLLI